MELSKVLTQRASIRKYTDEMPDKEFIRKITDAALLAPVVRWHKFHLSVVTDPKVMHMAEEAANEFANTQIPKKFMYGAPVWIILSGERHQDDNPATERMKNDNLFWNVGSIIENMELQAVDLGLASCGMNATIVAINGKEEIKRAAGIPEGYDALASVLVGYTEEPVKEREVNPQLIPLTWIEG